jgi:DNA-binding CsgD family transcriptional regulator
VAEAYGRDSERRSLVKLLPEQGSRGRLALVRGPAGIGKTSLLRAATEEWAAVGAALLWLDPTPSTADGASDAVDAVDALLRAVRDGFAQLAVPGLAESISSLSRLRSRADDPARQAALRSALGALLYRICANRPCVLVLDPVEAARDAAVVLESARHAGCLAVATCRTDPSPPAGVEELTVLADHVIELADLPAEVIERLVTRSTAPHLDESLLPALRASLGPLFGNPGTVLATLDALHASGRLAVVVSRQCLVDRLRPIPLPADHVLLDHVRQLGPTARQAITLVATLGWLRVDDVDTLADAIVVDVHELGLAVDALVAAGVFVVDALGYVSARCSALAQSLVEEVGEQAVRATHAALAGRLPAHQDLCEHAVVLAEHMTLAGDEFEPDAAALDWLVTAAEGTVDDDPWRASGWFEAALRHLPEGDPRVPRILAQVMRTAVRTAQYDLLGRVAERHCGAPHGPVLRADLASAAMLASLHTGRPLAESTRRALWDVGTGPFAFGDWWFGTGDELGNPPREEGRVERWTGTTPLLSAAERYLVAMALTGDVEACRRMLARLHAEDGDAARDAARLVGAGLLGDLVTVLRMVLGPRYGIPAVGVLATYHRVVQGYERGGWLDALSAARELELLDATTTQVHQRARLLAAEICAERGDARQAAEWLAMVTEGAGFGALRAWVRCGMRSRVGHPGDELPAALAAYQTTLASGVRSGLDALLRRSVEAAVESGNRRLAAELLDEAERSRAAHDMANADEVVFFAYGIAHDNMVCARAAADLARGRGHLPDLARACLVAGRLAEQPQEWLQEAYEVARLLQAPFLRGQVTAQMRARGVTVQRGRGARMPFSPTELRIIELLRDGLTNRQIATAVQVSEKTVESYLTRLFARTGYQSRIELAAASLDGRIAAALV